MSLSKTYFSQKKVLVIPRKRCLRPNMTEKLFTGTNQNLNLIIKPLAIFCGFTAWFLLDLVGNPENRYFHETAPILLVAGPSTPSNAMDNGSRPTRARLRKKHVQRQEENYYRDRPPQPKNRPKSSKGTVYLSQQTSRFRKWMVTLAELLIIYSPT